MTRERVMVAPSAASADERRAIVERARRRGFSRFVVDATDPIEAAPGEEVVRRELDRLETVGRGRPETRIVSVGDPAALEEAVQGTPSGGLLAIEWTGDRVIPLENAIAAAQHEFELWVFAAHSREVSGALGALEHGAHRVIVQVRSPQEVDELEATLEGPLPMQLDWSLVPVTAVRPVGVGDRVIVDTTSLLEPSEGLLIGSAAGFLFHVASEAVGSRFSRPRPFRVNAGAAHSYVLLSDGTTRYLSELEAGDAVLVCSPAGPTRSVRVGRIKIERRPLVLVTATVDDTNRTVFLQEAETVRLSAESGRVSTTELSSGARVHGVKLAPARHLGRAIEETIIER